MLPAPLAVRVTSPAAFPQVEFCVTFAANEQEPITTGVTTLLFPGSSSPSGSGSLPFCESSLTLPVVDVAVTWLL